MSEPHPSDVDLTAFAAGTLDEAQRDVIATHVRVCTPCRAFVSANRACRRAALSLTVCPPEVMARIDKRANGKQAALIKTICRVLANQPVAESALLFMPDSPPPGTEAADRVLAARKAASPIFYRAARLRSVRSTYTYSAKRGPATIGGALSARKCPSTTSGIDARSRARERGGLLKPRQHFGQ